MDKVATRQPLYGHTSQETAYLVEDYPFGFRLRCKIRYWIEQHPKHGFRFVSQTTNPKKDNAVWNKPKQSTYVLLSGCMYLDENGHVQWDAIGGYDSAEKFLEYVHAFPEAPLDTAREFVDAKIKYLDDKISGKVRWMVNNKPVEYTDHERESDRKENEKWNEIKRVLATLASFRKTAP